MDARIETAHDDRDSLKSKTILAAAGKTTDASAMRADGHL
jgi:hypothetical protein